MRFYGAEEFLEVQEKFHGLSLVLSPSVLWLENRVVKESNHAPADDSV
jgi:hypothetical protein